MRFDLPRVAGLASATKIENAHAAPNLETFSKQRSTYDANAYVILSCDFNPKHLGGEQRLTGHPILAF
jgi:hypothetical protein